MGYAFYTIRWCGQLRDAGYGVRATCDRRGCENWIDRGLGYLCGSSPHDALSDDPGCGRYFCGDHLSWVGPRGGCAHRGTRAWGHRVNVPVR